MAKVIGGKEIHMPKKRWNPELTSDVQEEYVSGTSGDEQSDPVVTSAPSRSELNAFKMEMETKFSSLANEIGNLMPVEVRNKLQDRLTALRRAVRQFGL